MFVVVRLDASPCLLPFALGQQQQHPQLVELRRQQWQQGQHYQQRQWSW